jgi:membrane protein required for colicin V production
MNWLDYLLIALVVFSIIAGLMRGLLRESIGLVAWVIGVWSAFHFGPALEPHLGSVLSSDVLRPWVARLIIFLAVVLVGSMIGSLVAHFVRLSIFSGMDRFWGGFFGLVRGLVMVGAFVILCHGVQLQTEPWWRESLLAPHAERIANILRSLVGERKIATDHLSGVTD